MWSLLPRQLQLTIIASSSILFAWGIEAVFSMFNQSSASPLKWLSLVVFLIGTVLVFLFELLWPHLAKRFLILQRKLFPDLNGIWKGKLISTWVNPLTGEGVPPIDITVTIRQGLFNTHVSLVTGESKSESTRAFLEPFYDTRRYRIWYSYNNDPKAQVQHRSSQHEGVAYLDLDWDTDQNRLTGRYYTARKTTGDIDVGRVTE